MSHHELPPKVSGLHTVLEKDFPDIERGIADFLVLRGGLSAATEGLRAAMEMLRRHIYIEEDFLFPALAGTELAEPVFAMSTDHYELWTTLARMEKKLSAQGSLQEKQAVCRILRAEVDRHVSKEQPIVFGHAMDALSGEEQSDLRHVAENRVLPYGWQCREPKISRSRFGPGRDRAQ